MRATEVGQIQHALLTHYATLAKGDTQRPVTALGAAHDSPSVKCRAGYSPDEIAQAPEAAEICLGCGNPVALASLKAGETVVDLGSGGGFDCFLAARRVGTEGRVIGVDMTPEMIERASANAAKGGYNNVEFRLGTIEALPVEENSVDLAISNTVIHMCPDKSAVFAEVWRVLKPGGRLAISDIVATKPLGPEFLRRMDHYAACANCPPPLTATEIWTLLKRAGFEKFRLHSDATGEEFDEFSLQKFSPTNAVVAATILAVKPSAQPHRTRQSLARRFSEGGLSGGWSDISRPLHVRF